MGACKKFDKGYLWLEIVVLCMDQWGLRIHNIIQHYNSGLTIQARPNVSKASGATSSSQSRHTTQPDRPCTQAKGFAMKQQEAQTSP